MSERPLSTIDDELSELKESLLLMGGSIESMLQEAYEAFQKQDTALARQVMLRDLQVDQIEKTTDELAVSILSRLQPTARDLRFACAALKITTDIERMGDEIVNVCERLIELDSLTKVSPHEELSKLFKLSLNLVTRAFDSFVNFSSQEAGNSLKLDEEVDRLHRKIYLESVERMQKEPEIIPSLMKYSYIAKYLERIADHATNVSEQVVFMVEGLDIRHLPDVRSKP